MAWAGRKYYRQEALGRGDWKLAAMLGAFVGFKGLLLTVFVGSFLGAVIGLVLGIAIVFLSSSDQTPPAAPKDVIISPPSEVNTRPRDD